jgi:hypothetical protein
VVVSQGVIDWFIFVTIQPDFVVISGTAGVAGYKGYWAHFAVGFLDLTQWLSILAGGLILSVIRLLGGHSILARVFPFCSEVVI